MDFLNTKTFLFSIKVIITISDVNDRRPVFEDRTTEDYCSIITEFHELAEPVLTIRASDGDDPTTQNGQIVFRLVAGNEDDLFRLESSGEMSAKIYPNQSLKGNYGNYTLTIQADDRGNPPNSAIAQYSICVQVLLSSFKRFFILETFLLIVVLISSFVIILKYNFLEGL